MSFAIRLKVLSLIILTTIVVSISHNVQATTTLPDKSAAIHVSACGVLTQSNAYYVLDNDVEANDSCFAITGKNVVLDLNGHTVTFDNFAAGVQNPWFEEGEGIVPAGWDLSKAPSAVRVPNAAKTALSSWHLEFQNPSSTQEIVSSWTYLPPNHPAIVYFGKDAPWLSPKQMYSLFVEYEDGTIVASLENSNLGTPFEFTTPPGNTGKYRLHFKVIDPQLIGSQVIPITLLDMRAKNNYGVFIGYNTKGLPWKVSALGSMVTIKNGKIVQGAGGSAKGANIWAYAVKDLTVEKVETYSWGAETRSIANYYSTGTYIYNCNVISNTTFQFNRHQLAAALDFVSGGGNLEIHDNMISSAEGWGCISIVKRNGSKIYNNTLNTKSLVINHHAIVEYQSSDGLIANNHITADPGQGILISNGAKNNVIDHNAIFMKSQGPSYNGTTYSLDAIRLNDYKTTVAANMIDNTRVSNNRIYISGQTNPLYTPAKQIVSGICTVASGPGNVIENNYIDVNVTDPLVTGEGMEPNSTTNEVIFSNNTIISNDVAIMLGGYASSNLFSTFVSNTFEKSPHPNPRGDVYSIISGRNISNTKKAHFIDNKLVNGATIEKINIDRVSKGYQLFIDWFMDLSVKDSMTGMAIPGAVVTIMDKNGTVVFSGRSDENGKVSKVILTQYERYGVGTNGTRNVANFTSNYNYSTSHTVTIDAPGYAAYRQSIVMDASKNIEAGMAKL